MAKLDNCAFCGGKPKIRLTICSGSLCLKVACKNCKVYWTFFKSYRHLKLFWNAQMERVRLGKYTLPE
ncbi:MAG TPA: hypothetical protein VIK86_04745 [Candidatus Paceibacterota bacterium]